MSCVSENTIKKLFFQCKFLEKEKNCHRPTRVHSLPLRLCTRYPPYPFKTRYDYHLQHNTYTALPVTFNLIPANLVFSLRCPARDILESRDRRSCREFLHVTSALFVVAGSFQGNTKRHLKISVSRNAIAACNYIQWFSLRSGSKLFFSWNINNRII